jgi:CheY-like chemotaxis protein
VNKPVLLVVDDDPQVLAAVRRDLRARYRDHYAVLSAGSGEEALATARELKSRGDALAMVVSDQRMPGMLGTEVLTRSREVYPLARRVLLTAYSDIDAAIRAINEAHLDHYLSKPWDPPEERLYPVLDDLLDGWQAESLPEATGLRLVGHQWSPRSHAIKDFLAGSLVPYRWLDVAERERLVIGCHRRLVVVAQELEVAAQVMGVCPQVERNVLAHEHLIEDRAGARHLLAALAHGKPDEYRSGKDASCIETETRTSRP